MKVTFMAFDGDPNDANYLDSYNTHVEEFVSLTYAPFGTRDFILTTTNGQYNLYWDEILEIK